MMMFASQKGGFAVAILKKIMVLLYYDVGIIKVYIFHYDLGIKENHLPQVPVKSSHKVARKVITNKLPHFFFIISDL